MKNKTDSNIETGCIIAEIYNELMNMKKRYLKIMITAKNNTPTLKHLLCIS